MMTNVMTRGRFSALIGCLFCAFGMAFLVPHGASAKSISIAPLEYRAQLAPGENKKGFIDLLNSNASAMTVNLRVQGFRQIDDQGRLEFYDNTAYTKGIKLDLDSITLGPGEGARIYFLLSSKELPRGDVFAAIIASPAASGKSKVLTIPTASAGTLLLLENGDAGDHHAMIANLETNWLQVGTGVSSRITVQNTDDKKGETLGFMPDLAIGIRPYTTEDVTGPLIFAGFSRVVSYQKEGNFFGPVLLRVATGDSVRSQLVFAITGYWRWLAPVIVIVVISGVVVLGYLRSRRRGNDRHRHQ